MKKLTVIFLSPRCCRFRWHSPDKSRSRSMTWNTLLSVRYWTAEPLSESEMEEVEGDGDFFDFQNWP